MRPREWYSERASAYRSARAAGVGLLIAAGAIVVAAVVTVVVLYARVAP